MIILIIWSSFLDIKMIHCMYYDWSSKLPYIRICSFYKYYYHHHRYIILRITYICFYRLMYLFFIYYYTNEVLIRIIHIMKVIIFLCLWYYESYDRSYYNMYYDNCSIIIWVIIRLLWSNTHIISKMIYFLYSNTQTSNIV